MMYFTAMAIEEDSAIIDLRGQKLPGHRQEKFMTGNWHNQPTITFS